MLTIKNIKELELNFCHNRGLKRITETQNKLGEQFYSFHFGPIGDGEGYNKEREVRLGRDVNGGEYQIFVMGLHLVTRRFITIDDVKTKDGLASEISKVLAKAQWWWENEVTK
jgi:hypothetical protein